MTTTYPPPVLSPASTARLRSLASEWHGGQSSALYAYASTGHVRPDLADEWREAAAEAGTDSAMLEAVADYFDRATADPRALVIEAPIRASAGAVPFEPTFVDASYGGARWYLIRQADCFDPPTYLVAADSEDEAIEAWADRWPHVRLDDLALADYREDYGDEYDGAPLWWTDSGPVDSESLTVARVDVRVTLRPVDRCTSCDGRGGYRANVAGEVGPWHGPIPATPCRQCAGTGLAYRFLPST